MTTPHIVVHEIAAPERTQLDDGTGQRTFTREEVLRLLAAAWSVSHESTATIYVGAPGQMRERPGGPTMHPEHAAIVQLAEYEA